MGAAYIVERPNFALFLLVVGPLQGQRGPALALRLVTICEASCTLVCTVRGAHMQPVCDLMFLVSVETVRL